MSHVLTYSEIVAASRSGDIIYEELNGKQRIRPLKFDGVDFVGTEDPNHYLLLMECNEEDCWDYNLYYRCWDSIPSDELRASTPWKEDPYKFLSEE